jgi:hypothetical protein
LRRRSVPPLPTTSSKQAEEALRTSAARQAYLRLADALRPLTTPATLQYGGAHAGRAVQVDAALRRVRRGQRSLHRPRHVRPGAHILGSYAFGPYDWMVGLPARRCVGPTTCGPRR